MQLDEKDRDVTRFLWLSDPNNPDSPLTTYRFKAILFGATCSSFILNATLCKHLDENKCNWVSEILKRDLYVGNILSSFSPESDALTYFRDMTVEVERTFFWSDSQIVLHWLSTAKPLKRFVGNRVEEIKRLTTNTNWKYCPTHDNPADLLTRGVNASQYIKNNNLWMTGPTWISTPSDWPSWNQQDTSVLSTLTADVLEHRPDEHLPSSATETKAASGLQSIIDINTFSKYKKLLRVTAYVLRFIQNIRTRRSTRHKGPLSAQELYNAEKKWLRICQTTTYQEEITNMRSNRNRLPLVKQLRLFIDDAGDVRCGGRIHNAPLDETTKFTYLLPAKHQLTRLIVRDAHEHQLHSGVNSTVTHLRQKYWIPSIRQCVRAALHRCVI